MSFESGLEQKGKNRKKLLALEKEGIYVFHGSPDTIEKLEPRQAFGKNKKTGKMEKDGAPAVFATPFADMAIFRALTNFSDLKEESSSSFGTNEQGEMNFSATKNLLDHAKGKVGRVYVLSKEKFGEPEGMQSRSSEVVEPVQVVEVTVDDLPPGIKIIKSKIIKT